MKKKVWVLIFGLLILPLFFLNGINAQDETPGMPFGLNQEKIENADVKLTTSWEYLSKEWRTILLGNSIVQTIDAFCTKISNVFFVLFSEPYSLSFKLFFIMFFWFYFIFAFYNIFSNFSTFSKLVSFGISVLLVLMSAHLKFLEIPANALIWLFFGDKEWWIKLIWGVVVLTVLVLVFVLIKKFGKNYKEERQKVKDALNSMKLGGQVKTGEAMTDALSKFSQK
ncbi:MAG: hypothetical protein AABW47_03490 [Nanoarchaeota archaeon]